MKYLITILGVLVLCVDFCYGDVNKLAIVPLKNLSNKNEKANRKLMHFVWGHIARREIYKLISPKEFKILTGRLGININDLHSMQKRDSVLKRLSSKVDYVLSGEITFVSSQIAVNIYIIRTFDRKVLKSTAIAGYISKIEDLSYDLAKKIIPSNKKILSEIDKGYKKSFKNKNYERAIAFASWALGITPRYWKNYYYRARAYEKYKAYVEAQKDYKKALQYYGRYSRKIKNDIKRMDPEIAKLKKRRRKILNAIIQIMRNIKQKDEENIFVYVAILTDASKEQAKGKLAKILTMAVNLKSMFILVKKNIRQAQMEGTSKKANEDLMFLLNKTKEIRKKSKNVKNVIANRFPRLAKRYYKKAYTLKNKGATKEAIKYLYKYILLKPSSAKGYYLRALAFQDDKKEDMALADFTKVLELNPENAKAYYYRGFIYNTKGQFEKAKKDFKATIKKDPKQLEVYFFLGKIYERENKFNKAIKLYNDILDINKNYGQAYFYRGRLYDKQKDYLKAYANYKRAIKLTPSLSAKIRPLLARVSSIVKKESFIYMRKGYFFLDTFEGKHAVKNFQNSLIFNVRNHKAYFGLGHAYLMLKDYENAIRSYSKAIKVRPKMDEYYYYRAIAFEYMKQYKKAEHDLKKALELKYMKHKAAHRLGMIYEKQKKYKRARKYYVRAIKIYAGKSIYHFDLARIYKILGNHNFANSSWMKARALEKRP